MTTPQETIVAQMRQSPSDYVRMLAELHELWRQGRVSLKDYLAMTEENSHRFYAGNATPQWKAELAAFLDYARVIDEVAASS